MKLLINFLVVMLITGLFYGCNFWDKYQKISEETYGKYTIVIYGATSWEYEQPFYFRIFNHGGVVVDYTFIELSSEDSLEIKISGEFIYGVSSRVPNVLFFAFNTASHEYWPNRESEKDSQIPNDIKEVTGNFKLIKSEDVRGYYLK